MANKTKAKAKAPPPPRRIVVRVRTREEAEAMEAVKATAAALRPLSFPERGALALHGEAKR